MSTAAEKKTNKFKTREAALKLKHGSPKVQEIIRAKCRLRLNEVRRKSFDMGRNLENLNDLKDAVQDILLDEIASFEDNLKTEDDILRELRAQESMLTAQGMVDGLDLDKVINCIIEGVLCPNCEKHYMHNDSEGHIACKCGIRLRPGNLRDLDLELSTCMCTHSQFCEGVPDFVFVPQDECSQILLMICSKCDFDSCVY